MKAFFIFILTASQVFASTFTGKFIGLGQATMHPKEKVRSCKEIYFQIQQTEKVFHVTSAGYKCQDLQAEFPEFSLAIDGQKLMSDSTQVGTITDSEITLFKEDKDEDFTYTMQLTKTQDGLHFEENWTEAGKPAMTVEGQMKSVE